ncbi:MAG: hypothetical protein ACI8W3_000424 [Myxococcota bacterium]|jgi:hypothetical protein
MAKIHMPAVLELGKQLGALVGKTAICSESATPNTFEESCHTARYLTRDDQLVGLCQVDLSIAAALGASLAMIPVGAADDAVKEGDLGANLTDAYSEVANIMAGLLCADDSPHVRWTNIAANLGALTDADKVILNSPANRVDVEVEIDGYGGGKMTLLVVDSE